jgi:hypothetical protein
MATATISLFSAVDCCQVLAFIGKDRGLLAQAAPRPSLMPGYPLLLGSMEPSESIRLADLEVLTQPLSSSDCLKL